MPNRKALLAIVLPLLMSSACEMMQPREDPVAAQFADIERRLGALERIVASGSLVELTLQVDELERQMAELQGRAESLEYNAEATASRQRDLYVDLDDRLQSLERSLQTANVLEGGSLAPGQLPVPGGSDRDNYQAAFELLKEQRYEQAAMAFQQFLVSFPESQLADNALYWLAESYYVTDRFEDALRQFRSVISKFPRSRKVPDALLKIGYSNYELKRWDSARGALRRVQEDYPDTTAARLAEQRLKRMDDEGH